MTFSTSKPYNTDPGGGGYITCLGYGYVPPVWVGFWAPNSLNKGPFFGRFSISKGGLSRNLRKLAKNGWFSAKIHHKSGYDGNFWQLEEGTVLKIGRQTPVHPQVMYPPPPGTLISFV